VIGPDLGDLPGGLLGPPENLRDRGAGVQDYIGREDKK